MGEALWVKTCVVAPATSRKGLFRKACAKPCQGLQMAEPKALSAAAQADAAFLGSGA